MKRSSRNSSVAALALAALGLLATSSLWLEYGFNGLPNEIPSQGKTRGFAGGQNISSKAVRPGPAPGEPTTPVAAPAAGIETALEETSWQNPFAAAYWASTGWMFAGKSMSCEATPSAAATFRRPYKKLMLSLKFEPASTPFAIRLVEPASQAATIIEFGDEIIVSAEIPEHTTTVMGRKKRIAVDNAAGPASLRLVATGNRLSVAWNGRRVLFCDQPAQQSGKPLTISLASRGAALRITELRIEGE